MTEPSPTIQPGPASTATTTCPPKHVVYLSEMLARNALILHQMRNPACPGVEYFPCDDHFHIGHHRRAEGELCKSLSQPLSPQ